MFHDSSSWVFPHSEICGSKLICSSPQLIAACHVLLRLLMPRHSPYALIRLNFLLNFLQLFSLNCLSFIEHLFWFFRSKKVWSFLRFFFPSGWDLTLNLGNCSSLPKLIGKTYSNLFCLLKCVLFYLFVSTHFTSLFGFQWTFSLRSTFVFGGGLKWTRTTDLALIRRAL